MYRGTAEQDVMDVLAEVRRDYKIDPNRIYLMGHSMGGYGTWSVAMAHPNLFAAIGPISAPFKGDIEQNRRLRAVGGGQDHAVLEEASRRWSRASPDRTDRPPACC